ncbi:caspase recruitment domain-containing protein 18-like [Halichoeres trimaculatus]|uniref:caspase recruitment domain-containing protein 18-like n=1 Tax=Halichoeres trimaculatus TaxID=147232 RepID=UPI003D9EF8EF
MAAKVLDQVRCNFVENVGQVVIKQLLDDLQKDRVLNKGEAESIIEKHPERADRARNLIDSVMGKGDAASRAMINRLQERDLALSTQLGLQKELAASVSQEEQHFCLSSPVSLLKHHGQTE